MSQSADDLRSDVTTAAQSELRRTLALLLATQQELIHSRQQRDREMRVLDGIVRFSETAAALQSTDEFWDCVAEACASAFECETALIMECEGGNCRVLAQRGPAPTDPTELAAVQTAAMAAMGRGSIVVAKEDLASTRCAGLAMSALLVAPLGNPHGPVTRHVVAGLTQSKSAFFPPLDAMSAPGLRLFSSSVQALLEMLLSRSQTAGQLAALDRSHRALAESESQHRQLFEGSADGLALCAVEDGSLLDCNRALTALIGCDRADLVGKPAPWVTSKEPAAGPVEGDLRTTAGLLLPVEVRCASTIRVGGRDSNLFVLRDISRRRRAEQEQTRLQDQLMQARKMESIGRLAGGVAHDFNNLLTVICGCAELLQCSGLDEPQLQLLSEILSASRRAQGLTQQLLTFSRKQIIRPVVTNLNEQVQASIKMYRRLLGEDIQLDFEPCSESSPILADPQQIGQVVGNLLINARDAIHACGDDRSRRIKVRTEHVIDPPAAPAQGCYVRLEVEDNGTGLDEAMLHNIFEPFFTTKEAGKGTGLGLATVFGIIQQNHGSIEVQSVRGKGATFIVHWPLHQDADAQANPAASPRPKSGRETLLLVEDDRGVREFAAQALRSYGYDVHTAPGAEEAMEALNGGIVPALLVTDVVMPKVNGRMLAEQVRTRMPGIPVLFISGYTDDIIAQHGVLREGVELLEKPFGIQELAQKIRKMLDAR